MKKYNKYEDWIEVVKNDLPTIPNLITSDWLEQQLLVKKSYFRNWGFCFDDLTNYQFEDNISNKTIRKVPFSTRTIFPIKHPFHFNDCIFHVDEELQKLHNEGINGEGVNVAIIDFAFEIVPDEIKECLVSYKNCHNECPVHFHGVTVATQLCGKNLGVAPKVNLWFYGTRQGKNTVTDDMVALKDIYNQNKKGANIKIINISASLYRENEEFEDIKEKLLYH